jgi:hypothetical protein
MAVSEEGRITVPLAHGVTPRTRLCESRGDRAEVAVTSVRIVSSVLPGYAPAGPQGPSITRGLFGLGGVYLNVDS